jgi:uncharacterized protein (TIGR02246 family)
MAKKQPFKHCDAAYAKAFNKGDAKGVAALYTRDAAWMVPNGPTVKGRKAFEAATAEAINAGWKNIKFSGQKSGSDGDLAYNVGRLTMDMTTANGTRKEKGKFVDIYKRQADGSWKIALTIFNSDLPAA